jgi:hypothetical protein
MGHAPRISITNAMVNAASDRRDRDASGGNDAPEGREMESHRFDILTRHLGAAGSRRQALSAFVAGAIAHVFWQMEHNEAAAKCKGYKGRCTSKSSCCSHDGLRCHRGRCRCKKQGWKRCPGSADDCTFVKADPSNCGACGHECPAETPCCINGSCQETCGGSCCADCFVELLANDTPKPNSEICCPGGGSTICSSDKDQLSDDRCCWPDQQCVAGECCSDGHQGAVICGGTCCPSAACCNGACCPDGQVCGIGPEGPACVSASRDCDNDGECLEEEVCQGGSAARATESVPTMAWAISAARSGSTACN